MRGSKAKLMVIVFMYLVLVSLRTFGTDVDISKTVGKSKLIPPDPQGAPPLEFTTTSENIKISLVKDLLLLPYLLPNHVILKLELPDVEELSKSDIRVFEDGREQGFILFKEAELRKRADIAIVIDTTGSMTDAIAGVRKTIINFAEALLMSGLDVLIGVVPYDDTVNPPLIGISPGYLDLSSPAEAKNYVEKITRTAGGAEIAYNAIYFAIKNMSWRPASQRIIIIITDEFDNYGGTQGYLSKTELLKALGKDFVVHGIFVTGNDYSESHTDYSAPRDVRQVVLDTGGLIMYTGRHANVDLASKDLIKYTASSWLIVFESDSPQTTHRIEVYYSNKQDKRYKKLENVDYVSGK